MIELDKGNYDQTLSGTDKLIVIDFWGVTCAPCIALKPHILDMEVEYGKKVLFAEVNIQGNRRLAMREEVMGLPAILFYRGGKKIFSMAVNIDADSLREKIRELLI